MVRLRRELATAPDGQISLTDPDARAMATRAQHSGYVGYNVQSVVDAGTHLFVAHEVTNQGHDRDQLSPMASAAKTALRRDDLHILADKGYFSGGEILACHEQGITATVPRPDTSGSRVHGRYLKADFVCDPDKDIYRCPAGVALSYRSTVEHSFGTIKTWMGHTHFPTRRLRNVRTEMALNVLACNIKRMVAMIGIRGVMAAIPG